MFSLSDWISGLLTGLNSGYKPYPTDGPVVVCKAGEGVCLDLVDEVEERWEEIQRVFRDHGYEAVVTSANDGVHSRQTLHDDGRAIDIRSRHIPSEDQQLILSQLQSTLGDEWDVVLESDHFHLEYDP